MQHTLEWNLLKYITWVKNHILNCKELQRLSIFVTLTWLLSFKLDSNSVFLYTFSQYTKVKIPFECYILHDSQKPLPQKLRDWACPCKQQQVDVAARCRYTSKPRTKNCCFRWIQSSVKQIRQLSLLCSNVSGQVWQQMRYLSSQQLRTIGAIWNRLTRNNFLVHCLAIAVWLMYTLM